MSSVRSDYDNNSALDDAGSAFTAATSSQGFGGFAQPNLDLPTSVHDNDSELMAPHVIQGHDNSSVAGSGHSLDIMLFHSENRRRLHADLATDGAQAPGAEDGAEAQPADDHGSQAPEPPMSDDARSQAPEVGIQARHGLPEPVAPFTEGGDSTAAKWHRVVVAVNEFLATQAPAVQGDRHRRTVSAGDIVVAKIVPPGGAARGKAASTSSMEASTVDVPLSIVLLKDHMVDQNKVANELLVHMHAHTEETSAQTKEMGKQTQAVLDQSKSHTKAMDKQTDAIAKHTESIEELSGNVTRMHDTTREGFKDLDETTREGFQGLRNDLKEFLRDFASTYIKEAVKTAVVEAVDYMETRNRDVIRDAVREGIEASRVGRQNVAA